MSVSVLFVCLGNICRSPTAEAVFRRRVRDAGLEARIHIDSAGTGNWHVGRAPDPRACAAAAQRGYELESLRARQVNADDFERFDYVLAMDDTNLTDLQALRVDEDGAILARFLDVLGEEGPREVPDPYYGDDDGFDHVLNLVEKASDLWVERLREQL